MDLILASTSPYRREQLARLGMAFRSVAPEVDEDLFKSDDIDPLALAEQLAIAKASAVAKLYPEAVVIGGDQLVALGSNVLGKPGTVETAVEQLLEMAGHEHRLITSIAVIDSSGLRVHNEVIRMTMRELDRAAAVRYVEADMPLDCAGSYKIESRGITLFERIEGNDHTAIVGMPLIALTEMLRSCGFAIP